MLLNRQRLFLSLAIFLLAMFGASCVDIPSEGITPPNYQSSVKYLNFGRGVDTISLVISATSYTAKDSSTVLVTTGVDTIRKVTKYTYAVKINRYSRYNVDFGQALELYVDGSLKSTLSPGQATNYITTPSGSRKIVLKGIGTLIDSIRNTKVDTTISTSYDTIRNAVVVGRKLIEREGSSDSVLMIPATATDKITVDSALIFVETERQLSISLIGDTVANQTSLKNLLRYGRIVYAVTTERKTFEPSGKVDTAMITVNNNSALGSIKVFKTSLLKDSISTLAFRINTGYRPYRVTADSTFKFFFRDPTSDALLDSLSLTVSKGKQYTIAIYDDAGLRKVQAFTH